MMIMFVPVRMMVVLDHENVDTTTNSSPIRLMLGGEGQVG